jgi:hypothetical protein
MTGPQEPEEQRNQPPSPGSQEAATGQPPCPPPTTVVVKDGFPNQFARLFFGVITLLVLYYSYEIIKPYLVDIFLALVLFFVARPLYQALTVVLFGQRTLASLLTCLILALVIILPLITLLGIVASQALEFPARSAKGCKAAP